MPTATLELGSDEQELARYRFSSGSGLGNEAVLTNKRLVLSAGSKRETHPLGRIRAVRVETGRNWIYFAVLAACAGVIYSVSIKAALTAYAASGDTTSAVAALVREGYTHAGVGAVLATVFFWLSCLAYRGYTRLALDLETGTKTYAVQNQDSALLDFITRIEHAL